MRVRRRGRCRTLITASLLAYRLDSNRTTAASGSVRTSSRINRSCICASCLCRFYIAHRTAPQSIAWAAMSAKERCRYRSTAQQTIAAATYRFRLQRLQVLPVEPAHEAPPLPDHPASTPAARPPSHQTCPKRRRRRRRQPPSIQIPRSNAASYRHSTARTVSTEATDTARQPAVPLAARPASTTWIESAPPRSPLPAAHVLADRGCKPSLSPEKNAQAKAQDSPSSSALPSIPCQQQSSRSSRSLPSSPSHDHRRRHHHRQQQQQPLTRPQKRPQQPLKRPQPLPCPALSSVCVVRTHQQAGAILASPPSRRASLSSAGD